MDCETVKKWLVKNSAESENMNWCGVPFSRGFSESKPELSDVCMWIRTGGPGPNGSPGAKAPRAYAQQHHNASWTMPKT